MSTPPKRSDLLAQALRNLIDNSTDIQGVAVISMDGLVISAELPGKMDQARVGAVAAGILNLSGRSAGQLGRGDLQQTLIQGTDGNVIITYAGKNAVFVALTGANVNLGMAFLEAREGAQRVAEILG
ncbi:MAG: roadblock/LC7 domain-containing protein [Chloroflexota bacterium]